MSVGVDVMIEHDGATGNRVRFVWLNAKGQRHMRRDSNNVGEQELSLPAKRSEQRGALTSRPHTITTTQPRPSSSLLFMRTPNRRQTSVPRYFLWCAHSRLARFKGYM